jgi:hypothetical protein
MAHQLRQHVYLDPTCEGLRRSSKLGEIGRLAEIQFFSQIIFSQKGLQSPS